MTEELTLQRSEGTSFTVTLARADAPAGTPVVVVIPAMGMRASYYLPAVDSFADAGIHAAVTELRGHEARGGKLPGHRYNFGYADLIDDLFDAVCAVRAALPQAPVIAIGHSLGGQIALGLAATKPGCLAGIVLAAASTPHWKSWSPQVLVASVMFPVVSAVVGHYPGAVLKFAGRESRGVMNDWSRLALTGQMPVGDAEFGRIVVPVLAVSVDADSLGPASAVDALVTKLPSAAVSREHLGGDGLTHFTLMRGGDAIVPVVADWLDRCGLRSSV